MAMGSRADRWDENQAADQSLQRNESFSVRVRPPVPGDLQTSDDEYKSDLNDVRHPWLKTGGGQRLSILEKPRQCLRDVIRRS